MNDKEKLEKITDYISAITAYYINVLEEEMTDYNRGYIKAKLSTLNDIRKKLKKLDKE